jgi:hypothetical protein
MTVQKSTGFLAEQPGRSTRILPQEPLAGTRTPTRPLPRTPEPFVANRGFPAPEPLCRQSRSPQVFRLSSLDVPPVSTKNADRSPPPTSPLDGTPNPPSDPSPFPRTPEPFAARPRFPGSGTPSTAINSLKVQRFFGCLPGVQDRSPLQRHEERRPQSAAHEPLRTTLRADPSPPTDSRTHSEPPFHGPQNPSQSDRGFPGSGTPRRL